MKTPVFHQPSCWECPSLLHAKSSYESSYCTGFPGKKQKRFSKTVPKRKVPDWCPKRISPPVCRIYGFINDKEAIMEFMLNHGSSTLDQGMVFPSARRYKLRETYPLEMTAKELYETLQEKPVSSIFPDEDFEFGELVEIDDGLKPYSFYYAAEKGFIPVPNFRSDKLRNKCLLIEEKDKRIRENHIVGNTKEPGGQIEPERELNSMCVSCAKVGNECMGTIESVWTGCVHRSSEHLMSITVTRPESTNYTPADLMHLWAKEHGGQFYQMSLGGARIVYRGKTWMYDYWKIERRDDGTEHVTLYLIEERKYYGSEIPNF